MYGMIHRAAREMVQSSGGEPLWNSILKTSGLKDEAFISGLSYPDDVTFGLIGAVAQEMNLSLEETLVRFGRFWIGFADASAYAPLMTMAGDDLFDFCRNLDRMHASIQVSLTDVDVPSFRVLEIGETFIRIAYISNRSGLEPFVTGLLEGLLQRFGHRGEVHLVGPQDPGVEFLIAIEG
jgi:guanylate cyclase soluble subunit beta